MLEIWQELVSARLSPDSVRRFRAHPDLTVLCHYERRRLDVAGRQLYGRAGRLLLAKWARLHPEWRPDRQFELGQAGRRRSGCGSRGT